MKCGRNAPRLVTTIVLLAMLSFAQLATETRGKITEDGGSGKFTENGSLVTFYEEGVPSGAPWWVTLDGLTRVSTSSSISFNLKANNGTYQFQASSVPGLAASPSVGTIIITGTPILVETIHYTILGVPRFATRITGWLHTNGSLILDQNNQPVRLQGLNDWALGIGSGYPVVSDSCPFSWQLLYPIMEGTYDNVSEWGFNIVRLNIAWANLEPTPPAVFPNGSLIHHWNIDYIRAMDDAIGNLTERGIAVIIVMQQGFVSPAFKNFTDHGFPVCEGAGLPVWLYPDASALEQSLGNYHALDYAMCKFLANIPEPGVPVKPLDGFIDAWKFVAGRYADDDLVIGADIINELYFTPFGSCSQLAATSGDFSLGRFYLEIGNAVRATNPNLLLVFEGGPADPQARTNLDGPFPNNVVYSFHYYPAHWDSELFDYQLSFARKWNVPVWVGEFDFEIVDGGPPDPNWQNDTHQLLIAAERDGVSWSFWGLEHEITWWSTLPSNLRTNVSVVQALQGGLSSAHYVIAVTEMGLPPGTAWSVNLNGWGKSSTTNSITFPVLNGSYSFVAEANGHAQQAYSLMVEGADVNRTFDFSSTISTTSSTSSTTASTSFSNTSTGPSTVTYMALGVIAAAVVVAVGFILYERKGSRRHDPSFSYL